MTDLFRRLSAYLQETYLPVYLKAVRFPARGKKQDAPPIFEDNNDGDENYQNIDEGSDHKDHNLAPLLLENQRSMRISETCMSTDLKFRYCP